ncbi:MAG: hypothetical protein HRF43_17870, partial [Phycisphaerae bacterium]
GIPGLISVPGAGGLPTYRSLIRYAGSYPSRLAPGEHVLTFEDDCFAQFKGLRRIVLEQVPGVRFIPPHPEFLDEQRSTFLYDTYDPGNIPQERSATIRFRVEEGSGAVDAGGTERRGDTATRGESEAAGSRSAGDLPYPILDPRNDPARTSLEGQRAQRLVGLLQGRWGLAVFLTITALAFTWGAGHALMPGHAKTVVAAYLISQKGNYWHAVLLAVIVTVTHTLLVVIVGLIIWLYQKSHPTIGAAVQLWLGIVAGLLVAGMGVMLIWRALTGRIAHHHHHHDHDPHHHHERRSWLRGLFTHSHPHLHVQEGSGFGVQGTEGESRTVDGGLKVEAPHAHGHEHSHAHGHEHEHGHAHVHDHPHVHAHEHRDHSHPHDHAHGPAPSAVRDAPSTIDAPALTMRTLLVLGISGGIVPCPTATIILLLGIGANVVAGALYAVGVFSLGLALTLMVVGFAALGSRRFAARLLRDAGDEGELSSAGRRLLLQYIPAASGAVVALLGAAIAGNYLHHLLTGRAWIEWLG